VSAALATIAGVTAQVVTTAALVAGALALVVTHRPALALPVTLDLLLAAGLLRLVGTPSWQALATAAAIVALRRLIGLGLRIGGRSWSAGHRGEETEPPTARARTVRRLLTPAWRP
jgi:hypothetical protein